MRSGGFHVGSIAFGGGRAQPVLILGPCVIESREMAFSVARRLAEAAARHGVDVVYKSSYAKANRTSGDSYVGPGLKDGLDILRSVREDCGLPVTTDVHSASEAAAADIVDLIQIPAFLCRQTDLVTAAARTGRPVNIKKGPFMSPRDMEHIVGKVRGAGNDAVMLTERGSFFGYGDLVVDFRSLVAMKQFGVPVCYDASHSVQRPGGAGGSSGGNREFLLPLLRAAVACGVDAVFCEVHPDPEKALCDARTQWPLDRLDELIETVKSHAAIAAGSTC